MIALSLVLALAVGYTTVEAAVHSVHHLGEDNGDHSCSVLMASQHVPGVATTTSVAVAAPASASSGVVVRREPTVSDRRSHRPDEGRAPPFARSA